MRLGFEVLGRRHLSWLRALRNENREWFMDTREIKDPEMQELWFRLSCGIGDLNLIIKDGEERVGFISVYNIANGTATIGRMMIEKKFKRQGYMIVALSKVQKLCKEYLDIEELKLEVKMSNIPARDLYVNSGFISYGFSGDRDTMFMKKRLA